MNVSIRAYRPDDLWATTAVHEQIEPEWPLTPVEMGRFLAAAACCQVAVMAGEVVGYAAVIPAPGLPGEGDLHGGVLPAYRRQGLGGQLLQAALSLLPQVGLSRVSHAVADLDEPTAQFLRRRQFSLDHEEVTLLWTPPPTFAPPVWPPGFALNRYPLTAAISHFRHLYAAAFGPHPWHQPYDAAELSEIVSADGRSPDEIIFLEHEGRPIGCIWTQPTGPGEWRIEPLIIHPDYQGRGLGRRLLHAGLLEASAQGVSEVVITLWRTNEVAYALYQAAGFAADGRSFYLTYSQT